MIKKILRAPLIQIPLMTALVLAGMVWQVGFLDHFENIHYDFWSARFRAPDYSAISIVAIDNKSINRLGDWPWSRSNLAQMVAQLSTAKAGAQGICLLYTQPETNSGVEEINAISDQIAAAQLKDKKQNTNAILEMLKGVEERLNHDAQLIDAVRRAKNAVLPIRFTAEKFSAEGGDKPSGLLVVNSVKAPQPVQGKAKAFIADTGKIGERRSLLAVDGIQSPFGDLAGKAGALGHINLVPDLDGTIRRTPLLVDRQQRLFPSMPLQLAIKHLNASFKALAIDEDWMGRRKLRVGHFEVPTDGAYQMLLNHNPQWTRKRTFSFADVLADNFDSTIFRNKIVLIGITADGMAPVYQVGSHNGVAHVEVMANVLARLLSKTRLSRPSWALPLEILALIYFSFILLIFIPRVSLPLGATIVTIFLLTWYGAGVGLLLGYGYHLKLVGPVALACLGFIVIQIIMVSRKRREEKLESNKSLGVSYQGQGMLDMAYEKYLQCPVEDGSVKNLLYNLGLDFERKRMFNKAVAVYQHIRSAGKFKDIKERIARLRAIDDPLAMTGNSSVGEPTIKVDDTGTNPTFGRYEIIRELGHGAMGTVYLGKDPKINRKVAIKTLEYTEVDIDELEEVKVRFFREAEAAGKLSHPNIVSIFDAGEEHDMAYIAMELLTGENLTHYCRPESQLSVWRVLSIISEVTAALEYAHKQGVVHRDIKPGNIMLLEDGRIKVTDFGIARVIDASRTRTGVILGTPSYMSPEQVAGKNVDGRSDLFSLGIVFYQMLTATKPFKGDNITAIMYAITHNNYRPLSEVNPDVPECIEQIIHKLLSRGVTKRYQSASQLAKALDACKKVQ